MGRDPEETLRSKAAECVRLGGVTAALTGERDDLAAKGNALWREVTALQLALTNAQRRNKQTPAAEDERKPARAASKADGSPADKRADATQRKLLDAQNELAMALGNNEGLKHRLETAQAENKETKVQLQRAEDKLDAVKGIVLDKQTTTLPVLQVLRTFKMIEQMLVRRRRPPTVNPSTAAPPPPSEVVFQPTETRTVLPGAVGYNATSDAAVGGSPPSPPATAISTAAVAASAGSTSLPSLCTRAS